MADKHRNLHNFTRPSSTIFYHVCVRTCMRKSWYGTMGECRTLSPPNPTVCVCRRVLLVGLWVSVALSLQSKERDSLLKRYIHIFTQFNVYLVVMYANDCLTHYILVVAMEVILPSTSKG